MTEIDELVNLTVQQLKAGRANQARLLATVVQELGDTRSEVLLSVIAGALSEAWPHEPNDFENVCNSIGLPLIESHACLAKALILEQARLRTDNRERLGDSKNKAGV